MQNAEKSIREVQHPCRGVRLWENKNKTTVCEVHYTADPEKDPTRNGKDWYEENLTTDPKTGLPDSIWMLDMELDTTAATGQLYFPHFSPKYYSEGNKFDAVVLSKLYRVDAEEVGEVLREFPAVMVLDTSGCGASSVTAALWAAVDRKNGRILVYDEYYETGAIAREHAIAMQKHENAWGVRIEKRIIDGAAFSKESTSGTSPGEEYERHFRCPFERAIKDRKAGMHRVNEYLSDRKILFYDRLKDLFWEIERYRDGGELADHLMDDLRYLCVGVGLKEKQKLRVQKW